VYSPPQPASDANIAAVGDFDHDGVVEVVALINDYDFAVYHVEPSQPVQPGIRSIAAPDHVPTDSAHGNPSDAAVADFDGDGNLDVALLSDIGDGETGTIEVRPGNGQGGFGIAQSFPTNSYESTIRVADLDGDGRP